MSECSQASSSQSTASPAAHHPFHPHSSTPTRSVLSTASHDKDAASPAPSEIYFSDASSTRTCCEQEGIPSSSSSVTDVASSVQGHGVNELPFSRVLLAHIGAALTLFLATTDATIVSTSLPTIVAELKAPQENYAWVGIAYLLTQTAFQPLYGRFSDLLGRKTVLYSSIVIFMIGSLLCGLAPSFVSLCVFRAIAGIGGGGIVSAVWLITSELVAEKSRAKWSQALSVTWSASAVAGPLLGGIFSDGGSSGLSWRWAFLINLPVAAFAAIILFISLRKVELRPAKGISWSDLRQRFDFIGLGCFMIGTVGLILGFSLSPMQGWTSPFTLTSLLLGCAALVGAVVYEMHTKREPLFPPSMFHSRTVGVILLISFLHNFAFNAGTFFLALYYQAVNGTSALGAGMRMLPYSLGSSLASMPAAWFIGYMQKKSGTTIGQKLVVSSGLAISAVGFGLLILLDDKSSTALQEIAPLFAGIGIGMLFHAPFQILTKALDPGNIASATSAFFLVRFNGATCGLAVAGAVFTSRLMSSGDAGSLISNASSSIDLRELSQVQPIELRQEMLKAVTLAIQTIWMVCTPCLGLGFLLSPLIRTASTEDPPQLGDKCMPQPTNADEKSSHV